MTAIFFILLSWGIMTARTRRQIIAVAAAGNVDVARSAEAFMGVMVAFAPISFFLSLHLDGLRCEGKLGRFVKWIKATQDRQLRPSLPIMWWGW